MTHSAEMVGHREVLQSREDVVVRVRDGWPPSFTYRFANVKMRIEKEQETKSMAFLFSFIVLSYTMDSFYFVCVYYFPELPLVVTFGKWILLDQKNRTNYYVLFLFCYLFLTYLLCLLFFCFSFEKDELVSLSNGLSRSRGRNIIIKEEASQRGDIVSKFFPPLTGKHMVSA